LISEKKEPISDILTITYKGDYMKKSLLVLFITLSALNLYATQKRYPVSIEVNTVLSCMKARAGGMNTLNDPVVYNKVLEQCSCYMDLLEKKYSLSEYIDLDSELQKNPKGKVAKEFLNYVKTTARKECF